MTRALVTGATAGLGRGFARALAERGHDLILVARTAERLDELAAELRADFRVDAVAVPADLANRADVDRVARILADPESPVEILVNNAGFGIEDSFLHSDVADEQAMIDVMVTAVMRLSHAALPGMVARGSGRLINVSSVAGWITGSTYSAAKSWVTVFTEGLSGELSGTGVAATAVCPGFTHTEFHERASMDMAGIPGVLWLDVDDVVSQALRDSDKGRLISVASRRYGALSLMAQYLPRPLVREVGARRARQR
ncbi:MAG: SDR family oxidoreductase [Candidatus Nanopelagicales bacterium]